MRTGQSFMRPSTAATKKIHDNTQKMFIRPVIMHDTVGTLNNYAKRPASVNADVDK